MPEKDWMFRKTVLLSAVAALGLTSVASASVGIGGAPAVRRAEAPAIQLAQMGEIDVYYDEYGRRVFVDRRTGEVVDREPRRLTRQEWRRQQRDRTLGRYETFDRQYDQDDGYEDGVVVERPRRLRRDDYQPIDPQEDSSGIDEFPPAPGSENDTTTVRRQPVERQPLGTTPAVREPTAPPTETAATEPTDGTATGATPPAQQTAIPPVSGTMESPSIAGSRPEVANLQVLLDRFGASPGVIDGRFGSNVDKAIKAFNQITGDNLKSTDTEGIKRRLAESGGDAFANYQITPEDAAGPYVASVPEDYSKKAQLDRLSYTSVTEALAERFHMDEGYLKALNPQANFNRPGTIVKVANFGKLVSTPVARITADKGNKQVRAYDANGKLVAAYPATIGSADTPSPTGNHAVSRVAFDPNYTYNPKLNFQQGANDKVLTIPPGPNGPVGSIWIALDKPTYGIHGTPDPSKIGKTESHGCVRLTNFDATELAKLVKAGVMVEFIE